MKTRLCIWCVRPPSDKLHNYKKCIEYSKRYSALIEMGVPDYILMQLLEVHGKKVLYDFWPYAKAYLSPRKW